MREKYHKLKKKYKDRKKDAKLRNAAYQETIQENEKLSNQLKQYKDREEAPSTIATTKSKKK
jgi:hypothetical protein